MVQTRRGYQQWVNTRGENYQSSQDSCESCSQRSQNSSQESNAADYGYDMGDGPNNFGDYGANDHCKRHRKPDNEPKTKVVSSYRRRTPR
jgi:hypothetical protein